MTEQQITAMAVIFAVLIVNAIRQEIRTYKAMNLMLEFSRETVNSFDRTHKTMQLIKNALDVFDKRLGKVEGENKEE